MADIPINYSALERSMGRRLSTAYAGGGDVEWSARALSDILTETERSLLAQNPVIVRGVAQIVLAHAVRATPPNASTGSNYRKEPGRAAVKRLQNRIAQDLMGSIKNPHTARVVKVGDRWLPFDEERSAPRSGINFIVPRNRPRGLKYEAPDAVITRQTYRFKRGADKVRRVGRPSEPIFVSAADLRRAVKKRQQEAGDLIAGWAVAGQVLSPSKRNNWDPGKGSRKKVGSIRFGAGLEYPFVEFANDWGQTVVGRQAAHFEREILSAGTRDVDAFLSKIVRDYFGR